MIGDTSESISLIRNDAGLVIIGDRSMYVSADARGWTTYPLPNVLSPTIADTGHGYVGLEADGGRLWRSPDGTNWTSESTNGLDGVAIARLQLAGGFYWAFGFDNEIRRRSWRSTDGIAWEPFEVSPGVAAADVLTGSGAMLALQAWDCPLRNACPIIAHRYWRSTDGEHWLRLSDSEVAPFRLGDRIVASEGWLMGIPDRTDLGEPVLLSTDGENWSPLASTHVPGFEQGDPTNFREFRAVALGRPGLAVSGLTYGQPESPDIDAQVWLGSHFTLAIVGETFTPGQSRDLVCLGGEGGDPGVVCVPSDLYPLLPEGARLIECPSGLPTVEPTSPLGDSWEQISETVFRLGTGECVGTPGP